MAKKEQYFHIVGFARSPEQRALVKTTQQQLNILIKASTQKRAFEIYQEHQGHMTMHHFRGYCSVTDGNVAERELACDVTEGIWWYKLDYRRDKEYYPIWSKPKTE